MKEPSTHARAASIAATLTICAGALTSCGQVAVFGHTIGEKTPASQAEAKPAAQASQPLTTDAVVPAAAQSTSASSTGAVAATQSGQRAAIEQASHGKTPIELRALSMSLTDAVATKTHAAPKLDADTLLATIRKELTLRKALDDTDASASMGELVIDHYALRPTSNAIVFGYIIHSGTLQGDLRVRDAHGNSVAQHRIAANARVSIPAAGQAENPLEPLYREFAIQLSSTLTGTPAKSAESENWRPR